jgi:hypothetical protein
LGDFHCAQRVRESRVESLARGGERLQGHRAR